MGTVPPPPVPRVPRYPGYTSVRTRPLPHPGTPHGGVPGRPRLVPWAQRPLPALGREGGGGASAPTVTVSSVDLARYPGPSSDGPGEVLDSIQVQPGRGGQAEKGLEGPGEASQGLPGGPGDPGSRLIQGAWDPWIRGSGTRIQGDPGVSTPGSGQIRPVLTEV